MGPTSRQLPVPPIPFHRRLWGLGPLVIGAVALRFAGAVTTDDGRAILEVSPWVAATLAVVAAAWFIGLVVLNAVTGGRRGPGSATLLVTGCMALLGGCAVGMFLGKAFRWRPVLTVVDGPRAVASSADGTTWAAFLRAWMDPDYAFVRLASRGALATRWDVVAVIAQVDESVPVVRPAALGASDGLVVRNGCVALLAENGSSGWTVCLSAVRTDGAPVVGLRWLYSGPTDRELPPDHPSPFFLVEPGDEVESADVERLAAAIAARAAEPTPWLFDLPSDEALARDLDSCHVGVRAAAERLVRAGGETLYPNAMARLRR